jgi:hypothetical protein
LASELEAEILLGPRAVETARKDTHSAHGTVDGQWIVETSLFLIAVTLLCSAED